MAHFDDLTPYVYFHPEEEAPGTVNVGWLDASHPFPTGETSAGFRAKLERLCRHRVKRTRGRYLCDFCKGPQKPGGSAEIRVAGSGSIYAAPELIHHYVSAHDYLPPEEFIQAVSAWEPVTEPEEDAGGQA